VVTFIRSFCITPLLVTCDLINLSGRGADSLLSFGLVIVYFTGTPIKSKTVNEPELTREANFHLLSKARYFEGRQKMQQMFHRSTDCNCKSHKEEVNK